MAAAWPLSADDWDTQMMFFLAKGYRVVAHDRRGYGRSIRTDIRKGEVVGKHRIDVGGEDQAKHTARRPK
jgi:non-heme chloroperoxidase